MNFSKVLELPCAVRHDAELKPTVTWMHQGGLVNESENRFVLDNMLVLNFTGMEEKDRELSLGNYICVVKDGLLATPLKREVMLRHPLAATRDIKAVVTTAIASSFWLDFCFILEQQTHGICLSKSSGV